MGTKAVAPLVAPRVLLAYDGSAGADRAMRLVARLSWPEATSFRLLEVVDPPNTLLDSAIAQELIAGRVGGLEPAVAPLRARGWTVEVLGRHGRAATAIVDEARQWRADLIVIGSRGQGPIRAMLLGSVAAEVVERAPCSVLVARTDRVSRVVLAWDGSVGGRAAVRAVTAWPALREAPTTVVSVAHVQAPLASGVSASVRTLVAKAHAEELAWARRAHQRRASSATRALAAAGVRAEARMAEGAAAETILRVAAEQEADLIVVGSRGLTGLRRMLVGSVARTIVHHAPASVLVARNTPAAASAASEREARRHAASVASA